MKVTVRNITAVLLLFALVIIVSIGLLVGCGAEKNINESPVPVEEPNEPDEPEKPNEPDEPEKPDTPVEPTKEITWITVKDKRVICDGEYHGVEVEGTDNSDAVEYSVDGGEWISEDPKYNEPGKYEVSVRVTHEGYKEYTVTAEIKILPDLSGIYINAEGILEIAGEKMRIGGTEMTMEYDLDGKGKVNETEFEYEGTRIRIAEKEYERVSSNVYAIKIGDEKIYKAGGDSAEIAAVTKDGGISITIDGAEVFMAEQFNYCERIGEAEIVRTDGKATGKVTASGKVTEIEVELSKREKAEIEVADKTVIYDGSGHTVVPDTQGEITVTINGEIAENIQRTEVGEYRYEITVIRNGYLPVTVTATLTILKDNSGTYYTADGIIEIDRDKAKINGKEAEYKQSAKETTLDGKVIKIENDIAEYDGKTYNRKGDESITVITSGDVTIVTTTRNMLEIVVSGGVEITVNDYDTNECVAELKTEQALTAVLLNGHPLKNISDDIENGYYIVIKSDLGGKTGWLTIVS